MMNNEQRAQRAREVLDSSTPQSYDGETFTQALARSPIQGEDSSCMVEDLMVDLLHLSHQQGWDTNLLIRNVIDHFQHEVENLNA